MKPLVFMETIEKRFPGVHALRNVRFDLRAGEARALMDENRAGRATLTKILSEVYSRNGGIVEVDGGEFRWAACESNCNFTARNQSMMNRRTAMGPIGGSALLSGTTGAQAQTRYSPLTSKGFQLRFRQTVRAGADRRASASRPLTDRTGTPT